jgi:adenine deaminase
LTDRGAVAPGYRADLVVVNDLGEFRPHLVFKDGRVVARDGIFLAQLPPTAITTGNTVRIAPLDESAFSLVVRSDKCPVIRPVPGKLVNRTETQNVTRVDGRWVFDPAHDVHLLASIERHRATGNVGLGLVAGFGLRAGALASSVAHDSHNLIVVGTNPRDMLTCVRSLEKTGGGFVVACGGEVRARLDLPVAGLLSREPFETVCRQLVEVETAAQALGCQLAGPFGVLSFLALPVIPELRVTDQGLWDVTRQAFVKL